MGEKAVLDTNVIISGFLWGGIPGEILDLVLDGHIAMATSVQQLVELRRVLSREKFKLPADVLERALATVIDMSTIVHRLDVQNVIPADPADDIILATAVASGATHIVTGDRHLLSLRTHNNIPILTPAAFLAARR